MRIQAMGLLAVFALSVTPAAAKDQALKRCEQTLASLDAVPPEQKSVLMVEGCKELFPPGPCRDVLDSFSRTAPDLRLSLLKRHCEGVFSRAKAAGVEEKQLNALRDLLIQGLMRGSRLIQIQPSSPARKVESLELRLEKGELGAVVVIEHEGKPSRVPLDKFCDWLGATQKKKALIRADRQVSYRQLVQLMDVLREAGIEDFVLAPDEPDGRKK